VADVVSDELTALLTRLGELAATAEDPAVPDAARIDRIALLERIPPRRPDGCARSRRVAMSRA
jgi:hypothetical protein